MYKRYVLFTEEMGVYIGNAMGLGFWSKLDPVGQDSAVTFETEEAARGHGISIKQPGASIREVNCDHKQWATVVECIDAGLPGWDVAAGGTVGTVVD